MNGSMKNEWNRVKLGEVVEVNKHSIDKNFPYNEIEYIDISSVATGILLETRKYDLKEAPGRAKRIVEDGDTIISTVRPNRRSFLYIKNPQENLIVSTGFAVLTPIENIDSRFLYYVVTNQRFSDYLALHAKGAAYPAVDTETIARAEIDIPSLHIQRKIASILSAYDDLIENNTRRIKILGEMAQTIYKEWFVNFRFPGHEKVKMVESGLGLIPEGWEVKRLGEVLKSIESGKRPKGGVGEIKKGVPSIGAENIIGLGKYDYSKEKYVSLDFLKQMNKGIVKHKDVLLYKDGAQIGRKTMFRNGFPHEICCINEHVFILRMYEEVHQNYLYFWLDQDWMTEKIKSLNANAAQPGINQEGVKSLPILLPPYEIVSKFDNLVEPILDELFTLANKQPTLQHTRELLLPKLISGELNIKSPKL